MPDSFTIEVPLAEADDRPHPGEAFHVENETHPFGATGYVMAATMERAEAGVLVTMPDGLSVRICRVPLDGALTVADSKRTQLSVFLNTEEMDADHDAGTPLMQVVLNDATLYDAEPNAVTIDGRAGTIVARLSEGEASTIEVQWADTGTRTFLTPAQVREGTMRPNAEEGG